ncbi:MAG: tetratricopeptide repeat protein, partial [Thermoanaerobaculia bacterium]|nr:tetratricopeptide repeat protein [Thermoanaerobaculia bacterium]
AVLYMWWSGGDRAVALSEQDYLLVADFVNTTGDPVFDDTLRQALTVKLQESPYLNVVADAKIRETLEFMELPADERITRRIGQEICQRQGVKAMMAGEIAALGSNYVVTLAAVDCQSGETLASRQVEAGAKEEVLGALGEAATAMRRDLGESLASIERYDAPIEQATTSSLPALKAMSLAAEERARRGDLAAIPFYERAIELDPSFAMAHARLGTIYGNMGEAAKSEEHLSRAFELRDRVSELERLYITTNYYNNVTREGEKSLETYALWKRTYPRDWTPYNNAAVQLASFGRFEESLDNALEAVRLNPAHIFPHTNASWAYWNLGRPEETGAIAQQALDRDLEDSFVHLQLALVAHTNGDAELRDQHLAWADGTPDQLFLRSVSAVLAAEAGKLSEAADHYRQTISVLERAALPGLVGAAEASWAVHLGLLGLGGDAVERARRAVALSSADIDQAAGAIVLGMAGQGSEARSVIERLRERFPNGTMVNAIYAPAGEAAIALGRGQAEEAIRLLERSRTYERGSAFIPYLRGLAYLEAGDGREAAAEFGKCIDWPLGLPFWALDNVSRLGRARAHVLAGDVAAARRDYQDLLERWAAADPGLPVVEQARAEYEALEP